MCGWGEAMFVGPIEEWVGNFSMLDIIAVNTSNVAVSGNCGVFVQEEIEIFVAIALTVVFATIVVYARKF